MAKHTSESVQTTVLAEWPDAENREIANGTQYILPEGTKINFYPGTAKVLVQGKDLDEKTRANEIFSMPPKAAIAQVGKQQPLSLKEPEKVFIVYGHDKDAREQLELLLRRLKLEPVILANMVAEGQTIIEMLEKHRTDVRYACVLLTPDDEGHKLNFPKEKNHVPGKTSFLSLACF